MAAAENLRDGNSCGGEFLEVGHGGGWRWWGREELDGDLSDDSKDALGPYEQAGQVQTGRVLDGVSTGTDCPAIG